IAARPGSSLAMIQLSRPSSILVEMRPAIATNAILNTPAGATAARSEPAATPRITGTVHSRKTSGITRPRAACARQERQAVGMMIASEVPTQSCMRTASGTWYMRNNSQRTGTIAAGIVTGILAGLFGIGGGAVIVPVLFELFRMYQVPDAVGMQLCGGHSLAIIIP